MYENIVYVESDVKPMSFTMTTTAKPNDPVYWITADGIKTMAVKEWAIKEIKEQPYF